MLTVTRELGLPVVFVDLLQGHKGIQMFHEWQKSVPSKENAVLDELLEGKISSVVDAKPKPFFSVVVFVAVKVLPCT